MWRFRLDNFQWNTRRCRRLYYGLLFLVMFPLILLFVFCYSINLHARPGHGVLEPFLDNRQIYTYGTWTCGLCLCACVVAAERIRKRDASGAAEKKKDST